MGVQCMTSHLDEDTGLVLDVLAEELHREVFCLDEEGIPAFCALWRDSRFQPLGTMDLPLGGAGLGNGFLLGQSFAHGIAQRQITGEVHRIHPRQ